MTTEDSSPPEAATSGHAGPVVVGIGASAGGLQALKEFFPRVPGDTGFAFVVVVHLAPDHESHLANLLQPHVKMPVQQVVDTVPLQPNNVYVIPPGYNLSAIDTHLRLSSLEERRIERAPIDHFFRTMARMHDGHSIGVILSGSGSDGSLGIKEIKQRGGLTVVQDPNEAEYDGMPQSAITTGMVDLVLPLADIPSAIRRFGSTKPNVPLPADGEEIEEELSRQLHRAFGQIRAVTGRDFGRYKRATVLRRIARRMQLQQIEEMKDYVHLLREQPTEVRALADDLLITVTNFFRDPEVFELLNNRVIPQLFADRQQDEPIRVWTVGCATGEEAYSVAMLLMEQLHGREDGLRVQLFASDLHDHSLAKAREGFYPGDIAIDVGEERLKRFFVKVDGGYRIRKEVRELVVFAPHNLLGDPPFSRMDLITCRNVLIYLQRETQRDVIELFHYALRPGGSLLLGTSETIEGSDLFTVEDKKACLHRKRNVPPPQPRLPVFPITRVGTPRLPDLRPGSSEVPAYDALHTRMIEQHALPSMLLSPDDNVAHLSSRAGRYLVHPSGVVTANVLQLVREELRMELRSAIVAARDRKEPVRGQPVEMKLEGTLRRVVVDVRPALQSSDAGFVLITFDEPVAETPSAPVVGTNASKEGERLLQLEREIDLGRQRLQALIEEYETGQEEMKATNEELQSSNEELRSTMEELETSKEELQSMNEELQTVNQENRHKVEELALLSSDLQNLLGATDIATLFLDRALRIMRFTPRAGELFNVRITDHGRPISDITHRLGYPQLCSDAENVLARLVPVEREVQDEAQRWYLTRLLPYRSVEDRIQGVVITFVDITERKRVEETLKQSDGRKEEFLAMLAHELRNPLAAISNCVGILGIAGGDALLVEKSRVMMQRHLHQLVRLIEDLLDVSRINRGKLPLHKVRTELEPVLRQARETVQASTGRTISLVAPDEPVWLDADPVRLAQVFGNLLTNACSFTDDRGHVQLVAERKNRQVVVSVQDDGVGIASEMIAELFQMFRQLHRDSAPSRGGLGIGLALVKRLVEMHGGSVSAASDGPDKGSKFEVVLPIADRAEETGTSVEDTPSRRLRGMRILVVDDSRDVADSLALLLEKAGNDVRTAIEGEEAVRSADAFRPDLMVLDLGMPVIDGFEVARRMRTHAWGRSINIVAMTGWGKPVDRERTAAAGFDAHLVKPVEFDALERAVAALPFPRNHPD